jgi:hypothetical protein
MNKDITVVFGITTQLQCLPHSDYEIKRPSWVMGTKSILLATELPDKTKTC